MRDLDDTPAEMPYPLPRLPGRESMEEWMARLKSQRDFDQINAQRARGFYKRMREDTPVEMLDLSPCEDTDPSYIITFSGHKVFLEYPSADTICLDDIAHALSRLTRCTGHGDWAFTLAQHSVVTSLYAPPDTARWALFHDAHEAYLGDVSTPLKRLIGPAYDELAARFDRAIAAKFGLTICDVKLADLQAMAWELNENGPHCSVKEWFGAATVAKYGVGGRMYHHKPEIAAGVWSQSFSRRMFLSRCQELGIA